MMNIWLLFIALEISNAFKLNVIHICSVFAFNWIFFSPFFFRLSPKAMEQQSTKQKPYRVSLSMHLEWNWFYLTWNNASISHTQFVYYMRWKRFILIRKSNCDVSSTNVKFNLCFSHSSIGFVFGKSIFKEKIPNNWLKILNEKRVSAWIQMIANLATTHIPINCCFSCFSSTASLQQLCTILMNDPICLRANSMIRFSLPRSLTN